METKDAGIGAAVAVLLAILGLIITVGIILLMMWEQPGIPHSPSQQGSLPASPAALRLPTQPQPAQGLFPGVLFRGEA